MDSIGQFQKECSAYLLATGAMYHEKPPLFAPLPGEALYEITQIFLNCVACLQNDLNREAEDLTPLTKHFFSYHFDREVPPENCRYPVEAIFAAFAVQDKSGRSPFALFFSATDEAAPSPLAAQAKKVTDCLRRLEEVIKDPALAKKRLSEFHHAFGTFLSAINHPPIRLKKIGENGAAILKKSCGLENVSSLTCAPGLKMPSEGYLNAFKSLSSIFEISLRQEQLPAFLAEWNRMTQTMKANVKQTDPFVKEFSECFEKMERLSWIKNQTACGLN